MNLYILYISPTFDEDDMETNEEDSNLEDGDYYDEDEESYM